RRERVGVEALLVEQREQTAHAGARVLEAVGSVDESERGPLALAARFDRAREYVVERRLHVFERGLFLEDGEPGRQIEGERVGAQEPRCEPVQGVDGRARELREGTLRAGPELALRQTATRSELRESGIEPDAALGRSLAREHREAQLEAFAD